MARVSTASTTATAPTRFPGNESRFVGVANVDILEPDAPKTIHYWIKERRHGVRFMAGRVMGRRFEGDKGGRADYVDDPKLEPAWRTRRELDTLQRPGDDA